MSWYQNQQARHEASKEAKANGEVFKGFEGSRQRALNDRMDEVGAKLEVNAEAAKAKNIARQDAQDAAKGAKAARKRERKLARKGLA